MIQIRSDFKFLKSIPTRIEKCVVVTIEKDNYQFKVAEMYNSSIMNENGFIDHLDDFLEDNTSPSLPFMICGDYNIDIFNINQLSKN